MAEMMITIIIIVGNNQARLEMHKRCEHRLLPWHLPSMFWHGTTQAR